MFGDKGSVGVFYVNFYFENIKYDEGEAEFKISFLGRYFD